MTDTHTLNENGQVGGLGAESAIENSESRLNPASLAMAAQLACFALRLVLARFGGAGTLLTLAGVGLAMAGIAAGVQTFRTGFRERGVHCFVLSAASLFFWHLQYCFSHDSLFV